MAVPVETPVTIDAGDGLTTSFPLGFTYSDAGEVAVSVMLSGVPLTMGSAIIGGNCVFDVAPPVGAVVMFVRQTVRQQSVSFPADGPFPSTSFALQLDRLTRIVQEQGAQIARDVSVPIGEVGIQLPALALRRDKLPVFDDVGAFGVLGGGNVVVALDSTGRPNGIPIFNILSQIGVTLWDDGAWGGAISSDDGVWG